MFTQESEQPFSEKYLNNQLSEQGQEELKEK